MKKNIFPTLLILISIFSFLSCKKQEGYGGNCAINGVLKLRSYNSDYSKLKSEIALKDEYVYIVFQDGKGYGDRVKTSYDGSFSFSHLQKGKYKIYAYSKDTTQLGTDDVVVIREIEITKNKQLANAGEIKVSTNDASAGTAIIRGKILAHTETNSYYATNQKVFIVYEGEETYSDYVYTDEEGEYQFQHVPSGNHKIYLFSKNAAAVSTPPTVPVEVFVSIVSNKDIIVLSDININK